MKISTKGRYGLRATIDLARHSEEGISVYLSDIAKRQGISEKYLEQIFGALNKAGIVRAQRGRKGGYLLNRQPDEITINEIITVLEGPCNLVDCAADTNVCNRTQTCITRDIWMIIGNRIEEILNSYTLASLIRMESEKTRNNSLMYYI